MQPKLCAHLSEVKDLKQPKDYLCSECQKNGSTWLHLRTCQICGITLCCDDSPNKHMTKHYHTTEHPVIISAEPGEKWMRCYSDELFVEYN